MARRAIRLGALALLCLLPGCRHLAGAPRSLRECPGALVSTREMGSDLLLRQRVRVEGAGVDLRLHLVVEKRGGALAVLGFDPIGAKLFSVVQSGVQTQVEALPAAVLAVPPLNLLRDLHRVRFLGAGAPPGGEGSSAVVRGGTRIREEWRGGALQRRSFERVDGTPDGVVRVEFPSPPAAGATASARVENGWCGYTASFDTLSEEPLP